MLYQLSYRLTEPRPRILPPTLDLCLVGCGKSPPASFSLRSEAQRTEAYASPLHLLRPCWTAFLSILREVLLRFHRSREVRDLREKRNGPDIPTLRVTPGAHFPLVSPTFHERRERILSGLRSTMVSLRFEPVEIISMGHSEISSRY